MLSSADPWEWNKISGKPQTLHLPREQAKQGDLIILSEGKWPWLPTYHNLPSLVLKAGHLSGSAFWNFYGLEVPEQALGEIPLGFGIVFKPSELSW